MIEFISVKGKNFLSIGENPVEINFKNGLNIITGKNLDKGGRSNGSGKSATLGLVYFAITGNELRGLNKTDIVNKKTKKSTEVVLNFKIGKDSYKLTRKVKPSELQLIKNGEDVTRDSINNTQAYIDGLMGCSDDVLKNCVIMGINQTIPFMAQSKIEKRKFIEGVFDLSVFTEMLKEVRNDFNDKSKELTVKTSRLDEKKKNLEIYKEQSENFQKKQREKIAGIKEDIEKSIASKKQVLEQKQKVDENEIKKLGEEIDSNESNINALNEKKNQILEHIQNFKSEIQSKERDVSNVFVSGLCPTCKREMSDSDTKEVKDKISTIQKEIEDLKTKETEFKEKLQKIVEFSNKFETKKEELQILVNNKWEISQKNSMLDDRAKDYDERIENLKNDIKKVAGEKNEFGALVDKINDEISTIQSDITALKEDIDILTELKFILGENGVKSFIINKMVNLFNGKINHYLQRLNANCCITFNEFFEEEIINDKRQKCSYFNFSSGERRNIDLAIMFAFIDLQRLQGNFQCNLMMFDELIDSSLDSDGVELVVDILKDLSCNGGKSIYLITHRQEAKSYATGETLEVEKHNGISKLKENSAKFDK